MARTIRIDLLPQDVQDKIMALRDKAILGRSTMTSQAVERTLIALENGSLGEADGTWAKTNVAIALGRTALAYFNEHPTAKTQFTNYLGKLQSSGRIVQSREPKASVRASA